MSNEYVTPLGIKKKYECYSNCLKMYSCITLEDISEYNKKDYKKECTFFFKKCLNICKQRPDTILNYPYSIYKKHR